MKNILLVLLVAPVTCFSQKIEISGYDKTLKKYVIETSAVQLKVDLDDIFSVKLRSEDTTIFLVASGVGGTARNISDGDPLIFFFSRRDSAISTSVGDQAYKKGSFADNYIHLYQMLKNELIKLQRSPVEFVRMYTATGFIDVNVKEKRSWLLGELVPVFLQEYNTKKKQF